MCSQQTNTTPGRPHAAHYNELLRLARETLAHYLATAEVMRYTPSNAWFQTPAAVFVTLRVRRHQITLGEYGGTWEPGDLRGCIGQIEADAPLYAAVQDAAIKAATADPRFYSVIPEELDNLNIEISVLSPMRQLESLDEMSIGQDGLLIIGEHRRGLLLPEVPLAFGWGKEAFVRALCQKAGLPEDAWPERAWLYAFTTESFED